MLIARTKLKSPQKSQLDAYAGRNPDAKLILVASDKSIRQFHARGTGEFDSYDRWNENVVSLDDLFEILDATVSADEHDASAEKVGRVVAREGNWLQKSAATESVHGLARARRQSLVQAIPEVSERTRLLPSSSEFKNSHENHPGRGFA